MDVSATRIERLRVWPVDIPVASPFTISRGEISVARNVFVSATLQNGVEGFGEIAPFPEVTGETRESSLSRAESISDSVVGKSALELRSLSAELARKLPDHAASARMSSSA